MIQLSNQQATRDLLRRREVSGGLAGNNGTVFATSGGSREVKDPLPPPGIVLAPEHYNRLYRLVEKKQNQYLGERAAAWDLALRMRLLWR